MGLLLIDVAYIAYSMPFPCLFPCFAGSDLSWRYSDGMSTPDIKAAFFDIDGTLTSFTTHAVPQSTIDALHQLQAKGIKVFICTGRAPKYMSVVLDTIPVHFDGVVGLNGQCCFDDSGYFEEHAMLKEDVRTLVDWAEAHPDIVVNFCEEDHVYFNHVNDDMRATWKKLGKTAPKVEIDNPRERLDDHDFFQVSPYVTPEVESQIVALCKNVKGVRWHPDFTDLIPADGGKPEGIKRFMKKYGWTVDQIIAFGDGGNDADMLTFAGIGVAMGNATEPAKASADYITDDVDHDGILNALKHFNVL